MEYYLEDCVQKINEETYEYASRIYSIWIKVKENAIENDYFRTDEFFMTFFIDGLRDSEVKRRMQIWFKEQSYNSINHDIRVADTFQQDKDAEESESETEEESESETKGGCKFDGCDLDECDFDESANKLLQNFQLQSQKLLILNLIQDSKTS